MHSRFIALAVVVAALVPAIALASAERSTTLKAALNGKVEVPKGDLDGTGSASITVDGRKVCWTIATAKVAKPNAAHIHKGRPGKAGPVAVPLGATYKTKGCTTAAMATAMALTARPGDFYVNVHNAKYAAGAVRGQLRK